MSLRNEKIGVDETLLLKKTKTCYLILILKYEITCKNILKTIYFYEHSSVDTDIV